jgi:hypothetical protein
MVSPAHSRRHRPRPDLIIAPAHDHTAYGQLLEDTLQGKLSADDVAVVSRRRRGLFSDDGDPATPTTPLAGPTQSIQAFGPWSSAERRLPARGAVSGPRPYKH